MPRMPLIPLKLLSSSASCGGYSVTLSILSLPVEPGSPSYFPQAAELGSSLRAVAFSTAPNQHFRGKAYVHWTLLAGTAPRMQRIQCRPRWKISVCADRPSWPSIVPSLAAAMHNHKEHGMARCNPWLHPIRPIGISMTHIPPYQQSTPATICYNLLALCRACSKNDGWGRPWERRL